MSELCNCAPDGLCQWCGHPRKEPRSQPPSEPTEAMIEAIVVEYRNRRMESVSDRAMAEAIYRAMLKEVGNG